METIHFPQAIILSFVSKRGSWFTRSFADGSLHSFKVETYGLSSVKLTVANGDYAPGVECSYFERLPDGYTWVKFKRHTFLVHAIRDAQLNWIWQCGDVEFWPDRFYAIKIESTRDDDDCHITTKDGKICPHTARRYFNVFGGISKSPHPKSVLEAFPAPVPGVQRSHDPGVWDAPTEHNSIPVRHDDHLFSRFKHPTIKPVAALRLELDADKNPLYRCSYFGPAPK